MLTSMKADIPASAAHFFEMAESHGFNVYPNISEQRLKVISLDPEASVLRFFSPSLRPISLGTQINGAIGIALGTVDHDHRDYSAAIFHNILNYRDMIGASRLIEEPGAVEEFFQLLKTYLDELPAEPQDILQRVHSGQGWIAQQFKWNDQELEPFKYRLMSLQ